MTETEPTEEEIVQAVYELAAEHMHNGASETEIKKVLMDQGLDAESADAVVANLVKMRSEARRAGGRKNMLIGALWCGGGIAVTVGTYSAASGEGGTYVVAWGAIAVGALQFLYGLVQSIR